MQRIWAPWRMKYIKDIGKKDDGCIFCAKPKASADQDNLIVLRGEKCFVILNAFPYTNGHLLIVPYLHTSDLDALDETTSAELWKFVLLGKKALTAAYKPDGFNIGMNLGRSAGAGIEQHLHMHIVPRWNGDVNFISIFSDSKVISQGLSDTYDLLFPLFKEVSASC
jgi:ATP adenylyltransferase